MTQSPVRVRLPRREPAPDHPLITVRATAQRLGCSEMTVRRRIYAKQIPAVRIGRKSQIPRQFVEDLLAAAAAGQTVALEEFAAEWLESRTDESSR